MQKYERFGTSEKFRNCSAFWDVRNFKGKREGEESVFGKIQDMKKGIRQERENSKGLRLEEFEEAGRN